VPPRNAADLRAQIAALQAELDDVGVYQDPATGRWYVKFRDRHGRPVTRRRTPTGEQLFDRDQALTAREAWLAERDAGRVIQGAGRIRFADYWERYINHRRGEITPGSWEDLRGHGNRRLLPFFGDRLVARIDVDLIREWRAQMLDDVEADLISPKTINNSRMALLGCLGMATADGLLAGNPVLAVKPLAIERLEPDYLRRGEIAAYLDSAGDAYRPLAEFMLGVGARVSEAIAVQLRDVNLRAGTVAIVRQRARTTGDAVKTKPTKGRNFRTVQIDERLLPVLEEFVAVRREYALSDDAWLFVAAPPKRGRYARRTEALPPNRRTVHLWHEMALQDTGLRDMPLHALRHTAAARWLGDGRSLEYVRRQLGHASIMTTSEYYGHLEILDFRVPADVTEHQAAS
jgi:integrase